MLSLIIHIKKRLLGNALVVYFKNLMDFILFELKTKGKSEKKFYELT